MPLYVFFFLHSLARPPVQRQWEGASCPVSRLGKSTQWPPTEYQVSCAFLYRHGSTFPSEFAEKFSHEWMLYFFKCFFRISWYAHVFLFCRLLMCRLHELIFANCICLAFWDQLHLVVGYHFYILVQFADMLFRSSASVFTRHVDLQSSCLCLVLLSGWCWPCWTWNIFLFCSLQDVV